MINVEDNFKFGKTDLLCKCCHNEVESQHHLLSCPILKDISLVADLPAYEDLFSEDADKIEKIGNILIQKYEKFKKFTPSAPSPLRIRLKTMMTMSELPLENIVIVYITVYPVELEFNIYITVITPNFL